MFDPSNVESQNFNWISFQMEMFCTNVFFKISISRVVMSVTLYQMKINIMSQLTWNSFSCTTSMYCIALKIKNSNIKKKYKKKDFFFVHCIWKKNKTGFVVIKLPSTNFVHKLKHCPISRLYTLNRLMIDYFVFNFKTKFELKHFMTATPSSIWFTSETIPPKKQIING